ncbi:MAG: DUF2480 family protein [Balneolaceae bacterium]
MEIVNKVKQSKLETVDLEALVKDEPIQELDLKPFLFKGLILKEKEFRDAVKDHDWSRYANAWVGIHCSTDALIPHWAWMVVASSAGEWAKGVFFGSGMELREQVLLNRIEHKDWSHFQDSFVLLKGCSDMDLSPTVYVRATEAIRPHVRKLMYGEACSNVPVYKTMQRRS